MISKRNPVAGPILSSSFATSPLHVEVVIVVCAMAASVTFGLSVATTREFVVTAAGDSSGRCWVRHLHGA